MVKFILVLLWNTQNTRYGFCSFTWAAAFVGATIGGTTNLVPSKHFPRWISQSELGQPWPVLPPIANLCAIVDTTARSLARQYHYSLFLLWTVIFGFNFYSEQVVPLIETIPLIWAILPLVPSWQRSYLRKGYKRGSSSPTVSQPLELIFPSL
jgi:hypothetical protein